MERMLLEKFVCNLCIHQARLTDLETTFFSKTRKYASLSTNFSSKRNAFYPVFPFEGGEGKYLSRVCSLSPSFRVILIFQGDFNQRGCSANSGS